MRFRTVALAVALSCGLTAVGEAKTKYTAKPAASQLRKTPKVKRPKVQKRKVRKVKRGKTA